MTDAELKALIPQKEAFIRKFQNDLKFEFVLGLSQLRKENRRIPELHITTGKNSFYDSKRNFVEIGIGELAYADQEKLLSHCRFLIGHESEHVLSTEDKAWLMAINGGYRIFCETTAKIMDPRRRFRKPLDYDRYIEYLNSQGYHLTPDLIKRICHIIQNCMEDGRIERIRSQKSKEFDSLRKYHRNAEWMETPVQEECFKDIGNPRTHMIIIMNQILALSTLRQYEQGFVELCLKTDTGNRIFQKIQTGLLPHINKGVSSDSCRECMEEALEVDRLLSMEILEAARITEFEQIISKLLKQILDFMSRHSDEYVEQPERGHSVGDSSLFPEKKKMSAKTRSKQEKDGKKSSTALSESDIQGVKNRYDAYDFKEIRRDYILDLNLDHLLASEAAAVKRKIAKIFKDKQKPAVRGQKSGKLDTKMITRLGMKNTNVFRRNKVTNDFDGCVFVLQDNSGSMRGEKRNYCCHAVAVIEESFQDFLPMKIASFTSFRRTVSHRIIKDWNEKTRKNSSWNFLKHQSAESGNADDFSIRIAAAEIIKRPESRKLLIVLSDGTPPDCEETRRAITEARKKGIKVVGIFFGDSYDHDDFRDMYQFDYILTEPEKIMDHLVRIVGRLCK